MTPRESSPPSSEDSDPEDVHVVVVVSDSTTTEEDGSNIVSPQNGSSVMGAIFNFTNSIVGAGAIGLGGAMALSGGLISVVLILFFGILTKLSVELTDTDGGTASYEDLASAGLGRMGRLVVMACKLMYSFGCLVAYIVVIKDNLGPALSNLMYGDEDGHYGWFHELLSQAAWFTWLVSVVCILPLCLLRDMTPLASLSVVSLVSMVSIVGIVFYMYFFCPDIGEPGGSFYENWLEIRPGVLER
jgi:amino acid permease